MKNLYIAVLFLSLAAVAKANDVVSSSSVTANLHKPIAVAFFPHNGPSIEEYKLGKDRVTTILDGITQHGFAPRVEKLSIGITSETMPAGDIVEVNDNIYISITATNAEIEGALLKYFDTFLVENNVTYFAYPGATLQMLREGKAMIEAILERFKNSGFTLVFPEPLIIGIMAGELYGKTIVESQGRLYISTLATCDEAERHFIKYIHE